MPPAPNPVLWFKPETLGAAASNVATWPDSSGNSYDLAQATGALQPIVSADPIPGAVFDGSKQLLGPATTALNFPNGYTLFIVMKEEAVPVSGHLNYEIVGKLETSISSPSDFDGWLFGRESLYSPTITSPNTYHDFEFYNSDFEVEAFFANDIDGFAWTGDYDTSLHVYTAQMFPEATMQGMRMLTRRDGRSLDAEWAGLDELGTNTGGAAPMPSPTQAGFLFLGLASPTPWWGPTAGFNGTIYEVLIYEGQLSAGDIAVTESYLNEKYSTIPPNRTYFAPIEVAQAEYNDTWTGLDVPTGTLTGDTIVIQIRFFPSTDNNFTIFIGATPFAWRYTGINAAVASTLFPGSVVRLRIYARVTQGLGETFHLTANSGTKTAPVRPFMVHMTTYRGLSASASSAPFQGNDSPPYGYIQQDVTYNFSVENVDDRAPNYQDHIADENWAAHSNSMQYLASVADVGSPVVTSTILAEGGTGPLADASGDIWVLFGLVFEADSAPAIVSYNCVGGECVDPGDGTGIYATLEACQTACSPLESYNCIDGMCTDPGDGTGEFATLTECEISGCGGGSIPPGPTPPIETCLDIEAPENPLPRVQRVLNFDQEIHRNIQLKIAAVAPLTLYGYSMEVIPVSISELTNQRNAYASSMIFPIYGSFFFAEIAHISTSDITWSITVDNGTPDVYTIPHGSGIYQKTWVVLKARKGKIWDWSFSCANEFQVIVNQSIVKAKAWNSPGPYEDRYAFGDQTIG